MRRKLRTKKSTYELSRVVRAGRWWRARRETTGLVLLGCAAIVGLVAVLVGHPRIGAVVGIVGLLYIVYAYTDWFNQMH